MEEFIQSGKGEILLLIIFAVLITILLFLDLFVINKKAHKVSFRSATFQTSIWVSIGLAFGILVYFLLPYDIRLDRTLEYYSAYLTEYSLSVDNIFVILLILRYFNVKEEYYHKILFWGIIGAVVFRAIFIFIGSFLVHKFEWILYIFGAFLIYSGVKLFFEKEKHETVDPDKNIVFRLARRFLPIINRTDTDKFWIRRKGKLFFTRLFLVVILIETTDIIFAVDSIPAAFAITQDEYVLYTSNMFSVLGLRAMFFLLASIVDKFRFLSKGVAVILTFIGTKMFLKLINEILIQNNILVEPIKIPTYVSLIVIISSIFISILISILVPEKREEKQVNQVYEK